MDELRPPERNTSRTVVIVAVGVLIVVAIAGIVLAGLRGREAAPNDAAALPTTPASAAAMTGTAGSGAAPADDDGPDRIRFAAQSDKLPATAAPKLAKLAETARTRNNSIVIATKFEAGGNRDAVMELAKRRTEAVRHALSADGVATTNLRIELSELPAGLVPARDADRVELKLR